MSDFTSHKIKLEAQLTNITAELLTIGVHDDVTDDWEAIPEHGEGTTHADDNTNADAVEELDERSATLSDLERVYRDTKRALTKLENGTYGICEVGGEPIEAERLAYKPDARTCTVHMNEEATLPL
jgi:DnaK suppressor protein